MNKMKEYAAMRKAQLKEQIAQSGMIPSLLIIQVGNNEASNRYIRNKMKDCEEIGITVHHVVAEEWESTESVIDFLNENQWKYSGVIVQQPLPAHMDSKRINEAILPEKDVDGFHPVSHFYPATAKGIVDYLSWRNFNLDGAEVVVIGRSNIVGKPLAQMLTDRNATVTLCHSHTPRIKLMRHVHDANLIISAVGIRHFLDCTDLKTNIIDVGINFDNEGKLCGDCYYINETKSSISPVPGGVGLLTRVALLENVVRAAYE
jgi:methylenetetrahydrofolate dehydrogenase (NADP+)/methenyltetrahydrofolate cyclohydrolase